MPGAGKSALRDVLRKVAPAAGPAVDFVETEGRQASAVLDRTAGQDLPLPEPLEDADAVVLTLDVTATPEQRQAQFDAFDHFLETWEDRRGEEVEAAGMPVFLVLTKCDLLATGKESLGEWMDHIEDKKVEVARRFREY